MKQKILRLCSIVASCFVLLFAIAGCGDRAILNLEIKPGTFEYTYEQDSDVSLENLIVIAHYNDETSTEVKYGDPGLTVTTFTTETTGKKDIEIKYGGKTLKVEVKCSTCRGQGSLPTTKTCPTCRGGKTTTRDCLACNGGKIQETRTRTCNKCNGNRTIQEEIPCPNCSSWK